MASFVPVEKKIYKYLSLDGTGNGPITNINMALAVASDVAPIQYYVQPPVGEQWYMHRMIVNYKDNSGFSADEWASTNSILTNGISLGVNSGDNGEDVILDMVGTPDLNIQTNAAWGAMFYDVDLKTWASGNEFIVGRWSFFKDDEIAGGFNGLVLDGTKKQRLAMTLRDDMTNMIGPFVAAVRGHVL